MPDFTNLPITSVVATLLLLAAIDTIGSSIIALINHNFDGAYLTNYLTSHVLKVATPILGMAILGHGLDAFGVVIPPIDAAGIAASASLAAYAVATFSSLRDSWNDKAVVPEPTPTP